MQENQKVKSHAYRQSRQDMFIKNGNGTYGGYKPGVINGPPPSTKRGKARTKCKWLGE